MGDIYDDRKKTGYSAEELWFEKENRRLINQLKSKQRKNHLKLVPKAPDEERQAELQASEQTPRPGQGRKKAA
jgi:hypothetical protein